MLEIEIELEVVNVHGLESRLFKFTTAIRTGSVFDDKKWDANCFIPSDTTLIALRY